MIYKKGQIAIFVIVGLILVAAITFVFLLFGGPKIITGGEFEPQQFIDKCVKESVRETVDVMIPQGGFVNPSDYKIYNNIRAPYLCKNINYYEPCITQYPLYLSKLEKEIEDNIIGDIEGCFLELEDELQRRNYEVSGGEMNIEVVLKPGIVEVIVLRDFSFSREESGSRFDSFRTLLNSPLYDLAYVANEIASQEAKFCYFEYVGYMVLHPEFDIKKHTMSDLTKIYTIKHKQSGSEMNIAVRGCAIPAGF